jgi:hypothetical protein
MTGILFLVAMMRTDLETDDWSSSFGGYDEN